MRTPGWTVRTRLTLLYGCLVLLAGTALLAVVYYLLDRSVDTQPIEVPVVPAVNPEQKNTEQAAIELKQRQASADAVLRESFRQHTVTPLTYRSLIALAVLTTAGLGAGWLIAGRTVRPLHRITMTARRVADRSLHERIALVGPRDELRELADTFDDMLSRLDAAFEGQRRFVANASHELKTPLAINRTLLEVAMNRPDAAPSLRQLGETLLEVNARHERLVDGLLTLARSESSIADPVLIDLSDVTGDVVRHARQEAERLEVSVRVDAITAPVLGDPLLLERLVQNLVHNGIRHNTAGGWLRVAVGSDHSEVRLVVTNSGQPVPASSIATIFEPFQRMTSRIGSTTGTGLGLSIVRSVVNAHGGAVHAKARTEGGMVVEVSLPIQLPDRASARRS